MPMVVVRHWGSIQRIMVHRSALLLMAVLLWKLLLMLLCCHVVDKTGGGGWLNPVEDWSLHQRHGSLLSFHHTTHKKISLIIDEAYSNRLIDLIIAQISLNKIKFRIYFIAAIFLRLSFIAAEKIADLPPRYELLYGRTRKSKLQRSFTTKKLKYLRFSSSIHRSRRVVSCSSFGSLSVSNLNSNFNVN